MRWRAARGENRRREPRERPPADRREPAVVGASRRRASDAADGGVSRSAAGGFPRGLRKARLGLAALVVTAQLACDDGAPLPGEGDAFERDIAVGALDIGPSDDAALDGPPVFADDAHAPDARLDPDADPAPDAEPGPEPDASPEPDAEPEPDAGPDPDPAQDVRFVAIGDVGKGNDGQRRVAAAIAEACAEYGGCDFAIMLGDNIYDAGVDDAEDGQWLEKFEAPYADVDLPFYATLGNHDYGAPPILQELAGGIGIDPRRGQAQVDYAATQDKFRMPGVFYRFAQGPVEMVSLNTASLFWRDLPLIEGLTGFADVNDDLEETLPRWAAEPLAPWRIAFGHHPYLSNGPHGNAGLYDGVFIDGLIGSGTALKAFFEEFVIGEYDVYFCGHDHSLQDLGDVEGTAIFVSGAGASTTDLEGDNPAIWQASARGFAIVEADRRSMTVRYIVVPDDDGAARPWLEAHQRELFR